MIPKIFANDEFHISDITNTTWYQDVFGNFEFEDKNLTDILSALLPYFYVIAGLILFGAIIISGFQFLFSAGDPKKTAGAKGCLTNAIIGFLIVFLSWWLIQIIEVIFHLDITGG
ncbi:hypothetical protein ISS86_02275 [Candidatus Microgenomates bacterium]|nr:hypothetical protein [Candidatus Microgenomates bacterium]